MEENENLAALMKTFPDCCVQDVPTEVLLDLLESDSKFVPAKKKSHIKYVREDKRSLVKYHCVLFRNGLYEDSICGHTPCDSWFIKGDIPMVLYPDVEKAYLSAISKTCDIDTLCKLL